MKLTGKSKELFRQYYDKLPPHTPNHVPYATFMGLHPSMQWGVYQDWADSMGYDLWVRNPDGFAGFRSSAHRYYDTRQEVRDAAIEKLNELINNG